MNTVFNLRLPVDLRQKIEHDAKINKTSINQYLLYIITKTVSYNDALMKLNNYFKNTKSDDWRTSFNSILNREPYDYDK